MKASSPSWLRPIAARWGAVHGLWVLHAIPAGVNIPQNFAILNTVAMESSGFRRWPVKRGYRKLAGSKAQVDKENPNGNASLCVRCNQCLEQCPQRIAIPEELEKAHAILGKAQRIDRQ